MKKTYLFSLFAAALMLCSCGGNSGENKNQSLANLSLADGASGDMEAYESGDLNAIEQARPTIMVLPSDNLLKKYKCLTTKKIDGRSVNIRDYSKYMTANRDNKAILSVIQDAFVQQNYPLQDLEQTLKQIETQEAVDMADGLQKDTKTMLLTAAQPDIILELDYASTLDMRAPLNKARKLSFTLNALDAYTSNVISSSTLSDILDNNNTASAIAQPLRGTMPKLMTDIQKSFSDILTRGRNVTVRINMDANSNQKLTDECIEGDTYTDEIIDYIKSHAVKGAYKMQTNTSDELTFTNVRIKMLNDDGTQYGVYDWTRDLQKYLRKNLGLKTENRSQGLGEVVLTVKGM